MAHTIIAQDGDKMSTSFVSVAVNIWVSKPAYPWQFQVRSLRFIYPFSVKFMSSFPIIHFLGLNLCFYALPLSVLTYIYLRIFWAARKNSRDIRRTNTTNPGKSRFRGLRGASAFNNYSGNGRLSMSMANTVGVAPEITSCNGLEYSVEDLLEKWVT